MRRTTRTERRPFYPCQRRTNNVTYELLLLIRSTIGCLLSPANETRKAFDFITSQRPTNRFSSLISATEMQFYYYYQQYNSMNDVELEHVTAYVAIRMGYIQATLLCFAAQSTAVWRQMVAFARFVNFASAAQHSTKLHFRIIWWKMSITIILDAHALCAICILYIVQNVYKHEHMLHLNF